MYPADVEWLPTVADGLAAARAAGKPVLLHPCGQGVGPRLDDL